MPTFNTWNQYMSILKIRCIYPARKEKKNLAQLSKFSVYICKIVFKAFFLFHSFYVIILNTKKKKNTILLKYLLLKLLCSVWFYQWPSNRLKHVDDNSSCFNV